ncbi:helix-turn-helix domain-containing protein, partial [Paraglaciecola hydrolytica]
MFQKTPLRYVAIAACSASVIIILTVIRFATIEVNLFPAPDSTFPWKPLYSADNIQGGDSSMVVHEDIYHLNFDFTLSRHYLYAYASFNLVFEDPSTPNILLDLTAYSTAKLRIRCKPQNELKFVFHLYEDNVSDFADVSSFRMAQSIFSCGESWQDIVIDLSQLNTPEWWLQIQGLNLSNQQNTLTKVREISLSSTNQSPVGVLSSVTVEELVLQGRNWTMIIVGIVSLVLIWLAFIMVIFRDALNNRSSTTYQEIAHRQLNVDSKREREIAQLLDYLLSNYSDAELSLEGSASVLGINRTKINELLKERTGQTFSGFLNKLRLTEAARL